EITGRSEPQKKIWQQQKQQQQHQQRQRQQQRCFTASLAAPPPLMLPTAHGRMAGIFFLCGCICLEVLASSCIKLSLRNKLWMLGSYSAYGLSVFCFQHVLRYLPQSVAYATWCGAVCALVVLVNRLFFAETITMIQFFFILVIIFGVVGLNLV
ncbi:unnamed protein product, partial [Polarella glacialis]